MKWVGQVARLAERCLPSLIKDHLEDLRVDHDKMHLQEFEWGGTDWIDLAQDRERWRTLVTAVMKLWVPLSAGNLLTS
jgi:hypothetical protein